MDLSSFRNATTAPSSSLMTAALRTVDPTGQRVDIGDVEALCDRLRDSARFLDALPLTSEPLDRAESFRYLLMMTEFAVANAVLGHDPREPMFSPPYRSHLTDWGAASPDGVYRHAPVRDDLTYRVHGHFGNAAYQSFNFRLGSPALQLLPDDVGPDPDGSFEFFVGGPPRPEPWWPIPAGTVSITTREFFGDWLAARRSRLRIECLEADAAPAYEEGRISAAFEVVGEWIRHGAIQYWADRSARLASEWPNAFEPKLGRVDSKLPTVCEGLWDLAPDEALVIELPDPEARFWAFQLASSLWHTLDYANRLTTSNMVQTVPDPDGVLRLVVAHEDPGVVNWLDTTGLRRGILILRLHGAANAQVPSTRLVKTTDLPALLPDAPRCTPEQRHRQIAERREGVARLLCD